ncbi:hypothetical protein G6F59_018767 [Rhizopus arrhizus]|nr:hypothetical protein G6F59_018767 [Rhizopus arrhizus]
MGTAPISAMRREKSGDWMMATISAFNFVTMSLGTAAGARTPNQVPMLNGFNPASSIVGTSGNAADR